MTGDYRAYIRGLLLAVIAAGCGSSPEVVESSLDLAKTREFQLRAVAVPGRPIIKNEKPVDDIFDWSLNQRGEIAILVERSSRSGWAERDLILHDGEQAKCLMRQRAEGPFEDRQVQGILGCSLNDLGSTLVRIDRGQSDGWPAAFVDAGQVREIPLLQPLPEDLFETEFVCGSQGHVAFLSQKQGSRVKPDVFLHDGLRTLKCMSAHNDPLDPRRRFRGFGRLLAVNARGQLLFEASTQRDPAGVIENARLCLFSPELSPDGKLIEHGGYARGEFRELARQGAVLPGTKIEWSSDSDNWVGALLNDRGDVVLARPDFSGLGVCVPEVVIRHAEQPDWQVVLQVGQSLERTGQKIFALSFPSLNNRGQVACAVQAGERDYFETVSQLLRVEPEGALTVLVGLDHRNAEDDVVLDRLFDPLILSDGHVVCAAELKRASFEGPPEKAVFVTDGAHRRLIARESDLPLPQSFQRPQIESFHVAGAGLVVLSVSDGGLGKALILATPEMSRSEANAE